MSEKKAPRTVPEIQQDYQNLCLKAGHTQYQVDVLTKDLAMMNEELRKLNFEAAAANKAAQDAAEEAKKASGAAALASVTQIKEASNA